MAAWRTRTEELRRHKPTVVWISITAHAGLPPEFEVPVVKDLPAVPLWTFPTAADVERLRYVGERRLAMADGTVILKYRRAG